MGPFLQDIRYGLRLLLKSPGFTLVAAITLGLGIGANTALFSVVNAVLIRPLPYPDSGRLVTVWNSYPKMGLPQSAISAPDYADRRDSNRVFESLAVYADANLNLTGRGEPERVQGEKVSSELFPTLGVQPALGRSFTPQEDRPGAESVVILGAGLWKRKFGADASLLGAAIILNGTPHTVVGIMPEGFAFPSPQTEIWVPLALTTDQIDPKQRGNEYLRGIARLKEGVTLKRAQADMDRITGLILASLPQAARDYFSGAGWGCVLVPLKESVVGESSRPLLVLLGAVVCVLLIACANVSNLQLARGAARRREIAIRSALGAGRLRLIRQLLCESVLLSAAGGLLGLFLAAWGVDLLVAGRPANLPRLEEVSIDGRVLAFTLGISLLSGILFGLAPALQFAGSGAGGALKEGGRGITGSILRQRILQILVVSQVSLALVLLIGAGLMLQSFESLEKVDPGFNPKGVETLFVSLPQSRYPDAQRVLAFFEDLISRVSRIPGVQTAAASTLLPLAEGNWTASFVAEGQIPGPGESPPLAAMRVVTPGYFATLGIPLLHGRDFADTDRAGAPGVVIVDAKAARRLWPAADPIGRRISFSDSPASAVWLTVVGVAGDVKDASLDQESMIHVYSPESQSTQRSLFLAIRAGDGAAGILPAVRREIHALDADQPIFAVRSMEGYVDQALSEPRFRSGLIGLFAGIALLLASLGIYAVISTSVAQRTNEFGIRMTLGAKASDVVALVLRQGMLVIVVGISLGVAAALSLAQLIQALLYGVSARDPIVFCGVSLFLTVVALLACYLPARRAARVDPVTALRYE